MSWLLEKGISSLKGQITNFTKDFLSEESREEDTNLSAPAGGTALTALDEDPAASQQEQPVHHHVPAEGFFGQASAALSGLPALPRFGRSAPAPQDDQLRQHCEHLESTVQRLLQQLDEVSEARDKEALELATLRRELRLRGHHHTDSGSGSGPDSGHSNSPQPDGGSTPQNADGTGASPALSDDGFTKLDPSETELWEATQELSQSLEAQVELHKKELEKYQLMKQDWAQEKSTLENTICQLKKQLNDLQDWQSPDADFANGNEAEVNENVTRLQKENEDLQNGKAETEERLRVTELKLMDVQRENAELTTSMEELDMQNQDSLNQILKIKRGVQEKYEALKTEYENSSSIIQEVQQEREILKSKNNELNKEVAELHVQYQAICSEKGTLEQKYRSLEEELSAFTSVFQKEKEDLLLKLSTVQSENTVLMTKLDSIQLDFESLEVKYSTIKSENSTLKTKLSAMQCDLDSAQSEFPGSARVDEHNVFEQSSGDLMSAEQYVIDKLRKIVSLEIPDEYYKDIAERDGSGKELEDQLDMVAALVKMTVDLRWKKDTLERNLVDYTRQLRDMSAQLSTRDKQVAKLEAECVMLRENIESLLDGLNVTPDKGMLPSIPETPEAGDEELLEGASFLGEEKQDFTSSRNYEEKDLNKTIGRLESEVEILREARLNFENETKRLRGEVQELVSRLRSSEGMLRNQDKMESDLSLLQEQCEKLQNARGDLQKENSQLREEAEMARFGLDSLQAEVSEWKTIADSTTQERQDAIRDKESLAAEVAELKANLAAASDTSAQLEQALLRKCSLEAEVAQLQRSVGELNESKSKLEEANVTIQKLKKEVSSLREELASKSGTTSDNKTKEAAELLKTIETLETENSGLQLSLSEIRSENAGLCEHIMTLQQKCDSLSADLVCKASSEYDNTQNFLHEKQALEEQITRMTTNYERVSKDFVELNTVKSSIETEFDQVKSNHQVALEEIRRLEGLLQQNTKTELSSSAQIDALGAENRSSDRESQKLREQVELPKELIPKTSPEIEDNNNVLESLERKLHSMLEEKEQILSVLNEKTRENGVLRSENQKLLSVISNQPDIHLDTTSDQHAQLAQQLNQLRLERDQLVSTVQVKHNESLRYHAEILRLTALLDEKLQSDQSLSAHLPSVEETTQILNISSADPLNRNQDVQALESKCNSLAASLQQEKAHNMYLQNEMQEQHEKEGILTRELERLRAHLMEVEEAYTAEALRLEEQVQDLQVKLDTAEERLRSVSTAHTSASILANQHVESLQGQSRLIGQQRDELQSKLSSAEDREQKHAAALRNLQAVLEQFQRDKERDLASMTEKLRIELKASNMKQQDLSEEIQMLKAQLAEAKEGLSAAARLGDQLDKKSETISALKEQISQLQKELRGAEERIRAASQTAEIKVDKSLVKNLVVGLLTAPPNTRSPALRVVASVLDFNFEERQRVGLEQGSSHNEQSLSEAFVRFLESESRPQMQLRLLPDASSRSSSDSKKDSQSRGSTSNESPVRRSPLLSEVVLPTLTPLPVGRSSSSILKDVLKNDV